MTNPPFVSVVMPIRNEARFIARSVGAVLAQDYPPERLELLVADGMSVDETRAIVNSLTTGDRRVRLIDNPGGIVATGLNAALREARGSVIVRVDGHCEIAPDYVSAAVRHLASTRAEGVGGPLETVGETYWARVIAAAMSSPFGVGNSAFRVSNRTAEAVDTVAFPAYTRAVIDRAGAFDEELVRNQDDEYNYRLRKMGVTLLLASDVRARYYSRSSVRSLWRQYFQYGYWKVRVLQKHPLQMRARQFAPASLVTALLASAVAAPVWPLAGAGFAAIGLAYVAANLAAAWIVNRRVGRSVLALSLAFATLHLAYGTGFLVGLVRFAGRWREAPLPSTLPARQGTA